MPPASVIISHCLRDARFQLVNVGQVPLAWKMKQTSAISGPTSLTLASLRSSGLTLRRFRNMVTKRGNAGEDEGGSRAVVGMVRVVANDGGNIAL